MRPVAPNALSQADGTCCEDGSMSLSMYTFPGETSKEEREDSRDVHCLNANLSEHDFERVGGLSERAVGLLVSRC